MLSWKDGWKYRECPFKTEADVGSSESLCLGEIDVYALTKDAYPKTVLEKLDLIVQTAIRRWAKPPECSPNTVLIEQRRRKYGGVRSSARVLPRNAST